MVDEKEKRKDGGLQTIIGLGLVLVGFVLIMQTRLNWISTILFMVLVAFGALFLMNGLFGWKHKKQKRE